MSRQRKLEVRQQAEDVTIGELVRLTDVRYSTLKFYTEQGMLPFQQAEENLTRRYKREESIRRIQWIKALRQEGKSSSKLSRCSTPRGEKGGEEAKKPGHPVQGVPVFSGSAEEGAQQGLIDSPKGQPGDLLLGHQGELLILFPIHQDG